VKITTSHGRVGRVTAS